MQRIYTKQSTKDVNLYICIIHPPKLTERQRKKTLYTPVYKRIGLSFDEYMDDDLIKPNEREFAERFTNLGFKIKWIKRNQKRKSGIGYLPSNDFIWKDKEWECKEIFNQKYSSISKRLRIPILQGKKNFLISMQKKRLSRKLTYQLAHFNIRKKVNLIERLIIFDKEGIKEIVLQKIK